MSNLNFWGKLNKLREEIKLEEDRKIKMREFLMREIKLGEGVRVEDTLRHITQGSIWNRLVTSTSTKLSTSNFIIKNSMPILASLIIAVILGGGVSLAAENSLPGDALYLVKVGVNEEVRGALAFSAKSKAELETRLAERRLEEAAELTADGSLSAETRERIEENFEAHAERVSARIAEFELKSNVTAAADLASKFETSLTAHEQILSRLESRAEGEVKTQIRPLHSRVRNRLQNISSKRSSIDVEVAGKNGSPEVKAEMKLAAEGKIGAAKNVIASVKSFIENLKAKLGAEATARAEARLKIAENLIVEAGAKVTSNADGEAFNLAQRAIRIAQEARLLVRAQTSLELGVNLFGPSLQTGTNSSGEMSTTSEDDEIKSAPKGELKSKTEIEIESGTNSSDDSSGVEVQSNGRIEVGL